jgi:AraC-like DNA-binding protein
LDGNAAGEEPLILCCPNGEDSMWEVQNMGTLELAVVGLAGSGFGTALGIPMVWPKRRRAPAIRLMGGWLLTASALVALISARLIGLLPATAAVEHTVNLLGFIAYPLLYLCLRQQSGRPTRVTEAWWLWLPAAVYLAVLVVRASLGTGTRVPFVWILPALLSFTALCAAALSRRGHQSGREIVPAVGIVLFLPVLNIAQIVRMLFGHTALVPALVPIVMTAGFVTIVGLVVWRALDTASPGSTSSDPSLAEGEPSGTPRYERSGLDAAAAALLHADIERALAERRLFADPHLTLGRLAEAVGATSHQVSEVLNRHAKTGFHELVNRYRVADVRAQLLDPGADRFTIEGIGAAAGFGSRSALYAAFRRLEGLTPTEFRARARAVQDGQG